MDMSSRSSMRTEEDFMDGASIRKLSDASASSISSTRVEEYCHYNRLSYQPSEDSQCYPVEITLGDHTFDAASLPNFSWMQRPVNNFNVPTGKRQTERENLIHYVMRYQELGEQSYQSLVNDGYRILKPGGYLEISEPDLSESDYDDVMAAVKGELLSVTDTHIIWRTVLAQKAEGPVN
ncbi:hypothetical protein Unana1_05164 [Umbelopsis nana]